MSNSGDYFPYHNNYGEENSGGNGGCGCSGSFFFWLIVIWGIIELISEIFY